MVNEEELVGGNSSIVTRIGDTVRRNAGPWTPAVHAFLNVLRANGINQVPEALGMDDHGREVLTFMPGDVVQYPLPDWVWHASILRDAATLLRRIHEASLEVVHKPLDWQMPTREPVEVVCHNDFAPYNMTFRNERFAGVFDFDAASPGPRIWDFAYMAYQLVPLVEGASVIAPAGASRLSRLDALIEAYGLPFSRRDVFETLATRLHELAVYSDGRAEATGRSELNDHAAMYRRDSRRMSELTSQEGSASGEVAAVTPTAEARPAQY
ncbi:phosphotransferase [Pseudarthrobacter sp. N5]|uniref:phosphotransferase n=1 Tax=Pseudarthrobacter sp. N5 TaxID=3418416 RepID=UPI003CFB173F